VGIEDFNYSDAVGEDIPEGHNAVHAQEKAQEKAREQAAEQAQRMAAAQQASAFFQQQEKKSKSYDHALVNFLIACIASGIIPDELLEVLLDAIRANHSPQVLLTGISLIYNVHFDHIHSSELASTSVLTYYANSQPQEISHWLNALQESAYHFPHKTLHALLSTPDTLARFFEVVLHIYTKMYSQVEVPPDLVNLSKNIVIQLKNMLEKYISEHSIEETLKN